MRSVSSLENIRPFRRSLLYWFRRHGRDLPWRKTRDPYAILVSEFMLQQTQVVTVIPYYNKWLRRFPDFASVSSASQNDVLHAWQGLGYYNRARNLRAAARIVRDEHRGILPGDIAAIRKLPGVGRYIANAVATFAFNQPVPIVEANSSRVLARSLRRARPDRFCNRPRKTLGVCRATCPQPESRRVSIPRLSILVQLFACRINRNAASAR